MASVPATRRRKRSEPRPFSAGKTRNCVIWRAQSRIDTAFRCAAINANPAKTLSGSACFMVKPTTWPHHLHFKRMCPFRDAYFVSNTRACQRKLLSCPASSAAMNLRGLVMPNDRKRPLGAISVGHGRHLRWRGTRPQAPQFRKPLPVWCIIRVAGASARSSPAAWEGGTAQHSER
jgi:hypothetical protein